MENKFDEIRKEIMDSMKTPQDLGKILKKLNITPDNPEVIYQIIKEAGIIEDDLDVQKAAEMAKNMIENLPQEMKSYLASMIENVSRAISSKPFPEDIQQMIEEWKAGEAEGEL